MYNLWYEKRKTNELDDSAKLHVIEKLVNHVMYDHNHWNTELHDLVSNIKKIAEGTPVDIKSLFDTSIDGSFYPTEEYMGSNDTHIKLISKKELNGIINRWTELYEKGDSFQDAVTYPRALEQDKVNAIAEDGDKYIALYNEDGNCWVKEFELLSTAIDWLHES